jgi:hypothetical protein
VTALAFEQSGGPPRLVQYNLNTHDLAGLYEVFPPAEAKSMLDRLEFHFTPKHGSWLNMAEIELNVVNRQCLNEWLHCHSDQLDRGVGSLGGRAEHSASNSGLAFHENGSTHQTQKTVSNHPPDCLC